MKQYWYLAMLCSVFQFASFGQIEITQEKETLEEPKVVEIEPIEQLKTVQTEVFIYANWSSTGRLLRSNTLDDGFYGDTLGVRANEQNLNIWSYGIGVRSEIARNVLWQGGITWMRNGESFEYQAADSAYSYQTKYNYISMPLKLMYRYGDRVSIYGGIGITPQLFFSYRQDRQWTTSTNFQDEETFKTRNGYNTFVVSGVANLGVQLRMNSGVSLFLEPEYRFQLNSSYERTDSFEHFGRAFGLNMGLTYPL
jgi:opacity protein-like surface antigen